MNNQSDFEPIGIAERIIAAVMQEYGQECFVSTGYAAGTDLRNAIANALIEARSAHSWRDIETAPKDGPSSFLAWSKNKGAHETCWLHGSWSFVGFTCCWSEDDPPTHWMPLPAPPDAKETR